jgi:HTH-type transcriptional regulator/antitoxin HipB
MLAANAADIGNIVRRRRTKASLSQGELADKIGVSRKWIADLERGHPRAQLHLVLDVLNALDALVDVIDAPAEESAAGTRAPATSSQTSGRRELRGMAEGLATLANAVDHMPKVAIPLELIRSLERITKSMQLQPETQRAIDRVRQLAVINPEQMAAMRSALAHVQLDENTLRAIRSTSKELTRAEADWSGVPRLGSRDTDRIDDYGDDA